MIPKIHVRRIEQLNESDAASLFNTVWRLIKHIQQATKTNASVIGINNGEESGQEIPHVHVHIIPRSKGNGGTPIHAIMHRLPRISKGELEEIAEQIKSKIDSDTPT